MIEWIKIVLPGVIPAVVAAYLSARWTANRFYREKWWEQKYKAYSELFDMLYDMIQYCDLMADIEQHGRTPEHPKKKEFGQKYTEAYWKILKTTDIGSFVISEKATYILKSLRERPRLKWEENPPWDIYEDDCNHYQKALTDIREIASVELKRRTWKWFA